MREDMHLQSQHLLVFVLSRVRCGKGAWVIKSYFSSGLGFFLSSILCFEVSSFFHAKLPFCCRTMRICTVCCQTPLGTGSIKRNLMATYGN